MFFSEKQKKNGRIAAVLFVSLLIFSSCSGGTIGFGQAIDFEPPVLTLDPGPSPRYINTETILSGTVIDNVAMGKVSVRDAVNPSTVFSTITSFPENRWETQLSFTEDYNGKQLVAEIIAWDKAGNSGEKSVAYVTLVVDISPPLFDKPEIKRSFTRTAGLQTYNDLIKLEDELDPRAEKYQYVDYYQNGAFWLTAGIRELETYAGSIVLVLYDLEHDEEDEELYSANFENSNPFAPEWTIKEELLAERGDARGWSYSKRLEDGERIYLRASIIAKDLASNTGTYNTGRDKRDDYGYFCLYRSADLPRALRAGGVGELLPPGTTIPIDVFDDDDLDIAYIDLLTLTQYSAYAGATDREKLETIKDKLEAYRLGSSTEPVYNWKNQGTAFHNETGSSAVISNVVPDSGINPYIQVLVETGKDAIDCTEYRMIGIVRDKKSEPHNSEDSKTRWESVWNYYVYKFTLVDDSAGLIVIDITDTSSAEYQSCTHGDENCRHNGYDVISGASSGNSPEESTFPSLTDGKYFVINGYTLDESTTDVPGRIDTIKIAWIPFNITGGQDANVDNVKEAMRGNKPYPAGVQYWTLPEINNNYVFNNATEISTWDDVYAGETSYFITGTRQNISGVSYTKQTFQKMFNVLGDEPDDLESGYMNFHYNGVLENETKLFVVYAKNSKGNETFRTIRLLGNKNPPKLTVFDFTNRDFSFDLPSNFKEEDGDTYSYYDSIKSLWRAETNKDAWISSSLKLYPRNKILKLYVMGEEEKGVQIEDIRMYETTNNNLYLDANNYPIDDSTAYPTETAHNNALLRGFNASVRTDSGGQSILNPDGARAMDITFITTLPEIQQRVFKFFARNRLNSAEQLERTVVVTNNAYLDEISTPQPNGTYGLDKKITLRAVFSAPVRVRRVSGNVPMLNIRYQDSANNWVYDRLPFEGTYNGEGYTDPIMYMDFTFTVEEGFKGRLETLDFSNSTSPSNTLAIPRDVPINLNGAQILDAERMDVAFIPGPALNPNYTQGYSLVWEDSKYSVQGMTSLSDAIAQNLHASYPGKQIFLDGELPEITSLTLGGKLPYAAGEYYFKAEETISFTLTASKPIKTSPDKSPVIELELRYPYETSPVTAVLEAEYLRPAGDSGMEFSLGITNTTQQGTVIVIGFKNFGTTLNPDYAIIDNVDNRLDTSDLKYANPLLVIDRTAPATNGGPMLETPARPIHIPSFYGGNYSENPILTMNSLADSTQEPWGCDAEYSLDGGVSWVKYPEVETDWTSNFNAETGLDDESLRIMSGEWELITRQRDKAGNVIEDSLLPRYPLNIKGDFPKIVAIGAVQPTGIYVENSIIDITLDFETPVYTVSGSAYIIVTDRNLPAGTALDSSNAEQWAQITAVSKPYSATDLNTTLTFRWGPITGKRMMNGITIREINLVDAVEDAYGNKGVKSYKAVPYGQTSADTTVINNYNGMVIMYKNVRDMPVSVDLTVDLKDTASKVYTVSNINGGAHVISTIPPRLLETWPKSAYPPAGTIRPNVPASAGNTASAVMGSNVTYTPNNKTITLKFDTPVKKEGGTITIRPWAPTYFTQSGELIPEAPIPPFFPNEGYYIEDLSGEGTYYVESFYEVTSRMDAAHKGYMQVTSQLRGADIGGAQQTSDNYLMTDSGGLSLINGLDYGPYRKTTQGLKPGSGYPADPERAMNFNLDPSDTKHLYTNNGSQTNWNTVTSADGTDFMIPDTAAKYVLDYRYRIDLTNSNASTDETGFVKFGDNIIPNPAVGVYRPTRYRDDVANIRRALH